MSRIKQLPSELSNKIAAGEVVERPASVVKELVENAIDAGATKITVEIKNGGISYICIADNGCGMDRQDAKTAFLRHATSKIYDEDDLFNIRTLGFRGEALASIAAVSKIEIMTKTQENDGIFLEISEGNVVSERDTGCPTGTTIIVRNLFFNTPARMKFLKKDSTEAGYISDIVERLVLSNPDISFKYIVDGKDKLFSPGDGNIKTCIYSVYGREYTNDSVEISCSKGNLKIYGFAGNASVSRGNRTMQSFFVNGRYIKNKSLTFNAERAYSNMLMTGKFPFFVIFIDIPASDIDINVHPAKQEVKFADERTVCSELYWAVKNALAGSADEIRNEIISSSRQDFFVSTRPEGTPKTEQKSFFENRHILSEPAADFIFKAAEASRIPDGYGYKIVGQLFGTFIVIEIEEKIILIDKHAAHERMIYEKIALLDREKAAVSQVLMAPVAVTLSSREYQQFEEKRDIFEKLGFEIEDFGNNSLLVRQSPADISSEHIKNMITEILMKARGDFTDDRRQEMLYSIACKAAVKGNSSISDDEIRALMDELMETGGINTCPHGRPIMISITKYELEKMFKRIQ